MNRLTERNAAEYEYNAARVYATGGGGTTRVHFGYELLRRPVGTRTWERVRNTQEREEAVSWAARSGFKLS